MTTPDDLTAFARDLVQDVLATAEATDATAPDAYTQRMIEHLVDAGELPEALPCYFRTTGVEVNGYGVDRDAGRVDLLVSSFRQDPGVSTLPPAEVETMVRRLAAFAERCRRGLTDRVDDASAAYDMVTDVGHAMATASRVRLFVLTNATSRVRSVPAPTVGDATVEVHVWDVQRLHRLLNSGRLHEPIVVDFVERFGGPLPCLSTPQTDLDYSVMLAIVPGHVLHSLYDEYGTRLLELNVRSFLQAKGSVNQGIRGTLLKSPERFLAYNNGISATASRVETAPMPQGGTGIARLHDLQIVNGGQTTASIHAAGIRGDADLSNVMVQAKITVVTPDKLEAIVPEISRYSNTQNKVTTADFSANDRYHVEVEKMARSIWAPSAAGDSQETHWFYERARGQYADELARQRTPARQRAWKVNNPTRQKITKTDLAKYLTSYDQLPHLVSRGAEKNFREFMIRMANGQRSVVDETIFRRLVAQAILFKQTERIVTGMNFGGYRANIVAYTVAKLSRATGRRLDLDAVWKAQGLSSALEDAIRDLCVPVQRSLTSPPRAANVGEWCKRPEAWTKVEDIDWALPDALRVELVELREQRLRGSTQRATGQDEGAVEEVALVAAIPGQTWFDVSHWAKQTSTLQPWQRGIAFSLGGLAQRGADPTAKQAAQGVKLLQEAMRLGFTPQEALPDTWPQ